jgi:multicomponent Na+:H+ antiporter subunit G
MMSILFTLLLISGLVFFTGGTVGILRFPDFYSRLHPAGKLDTFGLVTTMGALAIYVMFFLYQPLTALKIILIVVFVFITSPTATHAIVDAGVRAGLRPWKKNTSNPESKETDVLAD